MRRALAAICLVRDPAETAAALALALPILIVLVAAGCTIAFVHRSLAGPARPSRFTPAPVAPDRPTLAGRCDLTRPARTMHGGRSGGPRRWRSRRPNGGKRHSAWRLLSPMPAGLLTSSSTLLSRCPGEASPT